MSYGKFASQLVAKGYRVARVEQTEVCFFFVSEADIYALVLYNHMFNNHIFQFTSSYFFALVHAFPYQTFLVFTDLIQY